MNKSIKNNSHNNQIKNIKLLFSIWKTLKKRRKLQILVLFCLIFVSGFSEIVAFSLFVPFLSIIQNPKVIYDLQIVKTISGFFGITEINYLQLVITISFIISIFFATSIRLINLWFTQKISAAIGSEFSQKAYKSSMMEPYEVHLQRNSAELLATSTSHVDATIQVINNSLQMIAGVVISISILGSLLYINPTLAIFSFLIIGACYLLIIVFLKPRLQNNSKLITKFLSLQLKLIQEGVGSIRDVILDGSQDIYIKEYKKIDLRLRMLQAQNRFISIFPRFGIEGFGLIMIAILAYKQINSSNGSNTLVTLGVFALGAQRLLPSIQKIYASWAVIKGNSSEILKLMDALKVKKNYTNIPNFKKIKFEQKIEFRSVNFHYLKSKENILNNLNLTINKGETLGIFGESGSGKSTFVDLLMGLLRPTSGQIIVDDIDIYGGMDKNFYQSWRSLIAHVPQEIFLSDTSIAENIALSIPYEEIDLNRVYEAAQKAEISNFIESLPKGYNTIIGERGIFLSGGQRQRIGVARALYKKSKVLILDEATSALDHKIESSLMRSIKNLNDKMTIIIVAHRLSTLKNCTKLIEISNKTLKISEKSF